VYSLPASNLWQTVSTTDTIRVSQEDLVASGCRNIDDFVWGMAGDKINAGDVVSSSYDANSMSYIITKAKRAGLASPPVLMADPSNEAWLDKRINEMRVRL